MGALSYQNIPYKMPRRFSDLSPYNVKALHHKNKDAKYRVMFLFDHITTGDLNNRKILSDIFGTQFFEICNLAADYYKAKYSEKELDWLAVPFNQFKTYGKDNSDLKSEADASFAKHVCKTINEYKPDVVVVFGPNPLHQLCANQLKRVKNVYTHLIGTSFDNTFTYKDKEHTCKVVPSISMNTIFNTKNPQGMYLAGYVARNLVTAFDGGKMRYAIPTLYDMKKGKYVPRYKTHYLTTVKDVEKCIKKMRKAKFVSIDTEAQSLLRVYNKIQTIQFCCSADEAYIIPIYHADSPFSGKELKRITSLLRDYFEDNDNAVQIYANGKFDLSLMKSNFDIRYYCAKVWDVQAGEFALDENAKLVATATGSGYYALGNLAVQYGCYGYFDNPFGKENRAFIADNPLTEPVIQYCALDVLIPWLIFKSQQKRARDIKYDKYRIVVSQLIGDQQHAFSTLESSGALCDIDYLFYLKTPDSPVNQIIREKEKAIYSLPAVKKVNEIISRDRGVPTKGLLGNVALNHFSLSKTEHKQILFFDVLKLKPISESDKLRANGKKTGKIDKEFKKKYEDHPAVAALNDLEKAQKIRNSYVDSFINMFGSNKDFKKTRRMRPNYSYRDVVTGRTSASDPRLGFM